MKAPVEWLKQYVEIPLSTEEYARRMVLTGTGVEEIAHVGDGFDHVVAGRVLTCDAHPDSDHLHVLTVDVGGEEPLQIVCGAPNVAAGQLVPVALIGATLPGDVHIKKGKLRGVASSGMVCSGPELGVPEGLYPHCGDAGILVFREEYAPGTDVKEIFGLKGDVVDFEILANRPDCLSIWGLARESAAVLDTHCVLPEIAVEEQGDTPLSEYVKIDVRDDMLCPRYCARVVTDVQIGPSPMWMRAFLHAAGVRPINNIVDITNFVMLETGHPMHAFDLDKVRGRNIVVRRAFPGEKLTTLDEAEHTLTEDMLVIADHEHATGLAGIMGGAESEITADTCTVLFEAAAFDRTNSRLTSRALGVRTESSGRFERGVCPETTLEALERACMLVNMFECGHIAPGAFDHYPNPAPAHIVRANVSRVNRLISANLSAEEMQDILESLYIATDIDGDELLCAIPAWRGDMDGEADVAEEVLRLHGYEHIPSTLMQGVTMAGKRSEVQTASDRVKDVLVGMGWYEGMCFSFVSPKWLAALGLDEADKRLRPVMVRNPLGEDTSAMRTSLVPSMLNALATNIHRGADDVKLFELAPVFETTNERELPRETRTLCLGMVGPGADFYALRDTCVCLLAAFGIDARAVAGGDAYYHPGRKAYLTHDGAPIGQLGEIHPDVAARFDIDATRVYIAEITLKAILDLAQPIPRVRALPKFPAVSRDLALVMAEETPLGPVMDEIRKAAGKHLERVRLFDIYRGAQLGANAKSCAFALSFRAADHTLTEQEITRATDKVLAAVETRFGAKLR